VFVASVLMFTIASLLCGASWSLASLVVFRILQGLVSGPMVPGSQALLLTIFPPHICAALVRIVLPLSSLRFTSAPPFNRMPTVLFGANHYAHRLPPSPSWLVWDKRPEMASTDQADCELAWTNLGGLLERDRHAPPDGAAQAAVETGARAAPRRVVDAVPVARVAIEVPLSRRHAVATSPDSIAAILEAIVPNEKSWRSRRRRGTVERSPTACRHWRPSEPCAAGFPVSVSHGWM